MKYSVIIPVYKAETTLERCLDSLLDQPHEDVEILLINDGSPDNSDEICRKYAAEHKCLRYFRKENGGVSTARNLGLDEAEGDYVLFVDSDDYVSENYFEEINAAIDEKNPDMLLFGYRIFGGRSNEWDNGSFFADSETEIAKRAAKVIKRYLFSSLWSKAFRRSIIEANGLRFDSALVIGEDQAFIFSYATNIRSLMSIEPYLYNESVENQDSLSRKRRDYLAKQLLKSNMEMISAVKESALREESKGIYMGALSWMFYRGAYSSCKELLKYDLSRRERRKKIREICRMFSRERIKPMGWKCHVIALPVKLKLTFVIDYLIRR